MSSAVIHEDGGILWSVDVDGMLTVELAPGGDGSIPMHNVTETSVDYEIDNGEEYVHERKRIVAYVEPWRERRAEITEARIGEGITAIPAHAFSGMKDLRRVSLPTSLREIGDEAFACSDIETVGIQDGLQRIGTGAFELCNQLKEIILPGSLSSMGHRVFHGCRNLQSATFGDGTWSINDRAFWDCKGLKSVRLPSTLREIGEGAFCGCKCLAAIDFPDVLREIGSAAFSGCEALKRVDVPDSVEKIGDHAFLGCEEATVPHHIENLDQVFGYAHDGRRIKRRRKSLLSGLFGKKG